jgi:hypothetical protein
MMNQPSDARNPSMISNGPGPPGRRPIDQKFVTRSVIETMASNMETSTYCPSPVWSRWRSAARTPMTPNIDVPMSPSAPAGAGIGGWSAGRLYS